jgi:hypothetical protein
MAANLENGWEGMRLTSIAKVAPFVMLALSMGFLGFVAGSYVVFAKAFPAPYVTNAYRGGEALIAKIRDDGDPFPGTLWQAARSTAKGVTIHDPAKSFAGPTLYTMGHAQKAVLVSPSGETLHEWHLPYSEVWDASSAVANPLPDERVYYRKAHLYPNGDLLVIYEGSNGSASTSGTSGARSSPRAACCHRGPRGPSLDDSSAAGSSAYCPKVRMPHRRSTSSA